MQRLRLAAGALAERFGEHSVPAARLPAPPPVAQGSRRMAVTSEPKTAQKEPGSSPPPGHASGRRSEAGCWRCPRRYRRDEGPERVRAQVACWIHLCVEDGGKDVQQGRSLFSRNRNPGFTKPAISGCSFNVLSD